MSAVPDDARFLLPLEPENRRDTATVVAGKADAAAGFASEHYVVFGRPETPLLLVPMNRAQRSVLRAVGLVGAEDENAKVPQPARRSISATRNASCAMAGADRKMRDPAPPYLVTAALRRVGSHGPDRLAPHLRTVGRPGTRRLPRFSPHRVPPALDSEVPPRSGLHGSHRSRRARPGSCRRRRWCSCRSRTVLRRQIRGERPRRLDRVRRDGSPTIVAAPICRVPDGEIATRRGGGRVDHLLRRRDTARWTRSRAPTPTPRRSTRLA